MHRPPTVMNTARAYLSKVASEYPSSKVVHQCPCGALISISEVITAGQRTKSIDPRCDDGLNSLTCVWKNPLFVVSI